MSATKILWGQILVVFLIVLFTIWGATQWVAWQLGFQPQLGQPWFVFLDIPFYYPPTFFWWWYFYDAYAPAIFNEGGLIAASGGFIAIAVAIGMSVWRAREAKDASMYTVSIWSVFSPNPDDHHGSGPNQPVVLVGTIAVSGFLVPRSVRFFTFSSLSPSSRSVIAQGWRRPATLAC